MLDIGILDIMAKLISNFEFIISIEFLMIEFLLAQMS